MKVKKVVLGLVIFFYGDNLFGNKYNVVINSAEIAVVEKDYQKANRIYSSIFFDSNQYMFSKDVWNYALSSIIEKDTATVIKCLTNLIEKDYDVEKINQNKYFKPVLKKMDVQNVKKKISSIHLYTLIDSLHTEDQKYRIYDSMYVKYKSEINLIDSMNSVKLNKIFQKCGFPSEKEIGSTQAFSLWVMLLHQGYGTKRIYNFSKYVESSLTKGKIEPSMGCALLLRLSGKDSYGLEFGIKKISYSGLNSQVLGEKDEMAKTKNFILGYYKVKPEVLSRLNKKREELGIGSVSEQRKKDYFSFTDEHGFQFNMSLDHYVITDEEQYKFFTQNLVIIDNK